MNEKGKWIKEIESSLNDIECAEVNPYLYSKILNKIKVKNETIAPRKLVFLSASALVLLIIINFFIFKYLNNSPSRNDLKTLSTTFKLYNENNVNYN